MNFRLTNYRPFLMPRHFMLIVAFAVTSVVSPAKAQLLTSGSVTSDADILNIGTTALAFSLYDQVNSQGPQTVNTVTFSSLYDLSGSGGITFGTTGITNSAPSGINSQSSILSTVGYGNGPAFLTLSNLIAGHTYQFQIFGGTVGDTGSQSFADTSGGTPVTLTYGPGESNYVVDTFVASNTGIEQINAVALSGAPAFALYNAVNVRDLGVVAVPEPSTWAMLAGGLVLMGVLGRRRSVKI